jgi:DNA invertase Pin-like site-specific DNA recombinase
VFTGEDSPMVKLMLSVRDTFAEFGCALIMERQREGNALAKQRGSSHGRMIGDSDAYSPPAATAPTESNRPRLPRWLPSPSAYNRGQQRLTFTYASFK